ncbi:uncharacterized protein [Miscanthus floridulus]|uniref:uncharacterized protein isoform X4 n=1 Tax=Miscanthus floridulus TaxID=154761 RepID=UPI0034579EF0
MDGQNSFEDKSKDIMEMETEESYGMILNVVLKWVGNKYFLSLCQCVTQSYRVTSTIPLSSACICLLLRQSGCIRSNPSSSNGCTFKQCDFLLKASATTLAFPG